MVLPLDDQEGWDLPLIDATVSLNIGELLLVDWVLVPGSGAPKATAPTSSAGR